MRKLRVLFMGTPEFSVPMLEAINKSEHELVAAVTAPDKPAGRGRKLSKSAVKEYAETHEVPILQPSNLKSKEFLNQLKALNPNVIVVVAFRMLPKEVWKYPEYGTFNLHASLLPQYRGAAPINWAIINGESKTGLTTFFIDEKIDTGEIIDKIELPISTSDTLKDVYEKMLPKGVKLVLKTLEDIKNKCIKTTKQEESYALKPAPKLTKENTRIDWNRSTTKIYNFVRGLSPYPMAWTTFINGKEKLICKVSSVKPHLEKHDKPIGTIKESNKSLYVAVKDGWIQILELKLSGKRLMKTKDLLNGIKLETPLKVE